jgi:hypothetical protein
MRGILLDELVAPGIRADVGVGIATRRYQRATGKLTSQGISASSNQTRVYPAVEEVNFLMVAVCREPGE